MNGKRIFITSMGIISPVGLCISDTIDSIKKGSSGLTPLTLFSTATNQPLPAGEIKKTPLLKEGVHRTHALALIAAREAMEHANGTPDAIVIGVTTGGMPETEELLKKNVVDPNQYKYHANSSVGEYLARQLHCDGPVITVSTACSSGTVALKIAMEMLRWGRATRILAGGVDALCRLTYYGFNSLQLVDPAGARPFDQERRGMTVAEGSAILFLTASETPPDNAIAELLGIGLSCDAYHSASPEPNGAGALQAMEQALLKAGVSVSEIDYVNLHGTGTIDNDFAEAKAVNTLFADQSLPPLSSIKGAFGHSLGAAGAMGAIVSILSISEGIIPASTGYLLYDQTLNLKPEKEPIKKNTTVALSNAFGFGGNNASLVVANLKREVDVELDFPSTPPRSFTIHGCACATGAGDLQETLKCIYQGNDSQGTVPSHTIMDNLSPGAVRRQKRLSRMVLSLAISASENAAITQPPSSVFFGTAWGSLSETYDFLSKLFKSDERFASPTDFIGSVHNAAAGQVAIHFKSTGSNVTVTGGDYSFEQALFSASLLVRNCGDIFLLIGADEYHEKLSPLFDASVAQSMFPSDGGAALILSPATTGSGPRIVSAFFSYACSSEDIIETLVRELGGFERISKQFGAIFVGIPAVFKNKGGKQLDAFLAKTSFAGPIIDYRQFIGEFASASAVATVLALNFVHAGKIPSSICNNYKVSLQGKAILVLGFGDYITAVEILPL